MMIEYKIEPIKNLSGYSWKCPKCKLALVSLSDKQVRSWAKEHMRTHE